MKKGITKDKICISIDKGLHNSLEEYCNRRMIKLSTYIEYLIKKGKENEK
mgnify:CR=1 FL=1